MLREEIGLSGDSNCGREQSYGWAGLPPAGANQGNGCNRRECSSSNNTKNLGEGGGEVSPETNLKGTVSRDFRPLCSCLKGQCHEISDLQFFSSFKPDWAMDQRNKIFTILVKISPSYSNKDDTMSLAFI